MKKASLSLTLNTIVMVIMAVVVIVLALVFIRGVFDKMGVKVTEAIDAHELVNPPTTDTPLTLTPPEQDLRQGRSGKITVAFLNTLNDVAYCQLSNTQTGAAIPPTLLYSTTCMKMIKDQINTWAVVVDAPKDATPDTNIFSISMNCHSTSCSGALEGSFSHDLVVRVRE